MRASITRNAAGCNRIAPTPVFSAHTSRISEVDQGVSFGAGVLHNRVGEQPSFPVRAGNTPGRQIVPRWSSTTYMSYADLYSKSTNYFNAKKTFFCLNTVVFNLKWYVKLTCDAARFF